MNININSKFLNKSNKSCFAVFKYFKGLVIRILISALLFLSLAIFIKSSSLNSELVYKYVYTDSIFYTKIKGYYDKYLSGVVPFNNFFNKGNTEVVFNEKLKYINKNKYYDGVKLKVNSNYLVPIMESGIVLYIGNKDNYENTVIVQGSSGNDIWYGNVSNVNVSLYDYVDKGSYLGEVDGDYLYLVFSKDGKFLNYEQFIS